MLLLLNSYLELLDLWLNRTIDSLTLGDDGVFNGLFVLYCYFVTLP